MKIFLLPLIFLLLTITTHAQWKTLTSGVSNELTEVFFLNQDTGFVVGAYTILKTEDGGISWQLSYSGNFFLEGIYFSNSTNGFAIGYDLSNNKSTIIKTIDAGLSWTIIDFTTSSFLKDIYFFDAKNGFIVGSGGAAFRTANGGISWDTLNTKTSAILQSVFFTSPQNGIIVGGLPSNPLILKTSNGGNSWTAISSPATEFLSGVYFPSDSIGYIVGWNGEILKTTDGGVSWNTQTAVAIYGNLDVFFVDDNTGYIVGGGQNFAGIQKTTDGGRNWTAQNASINEGLIGVFFPTKTTGYCVGSGGTILKTGNGGATEVAALTKSDINISTYPNPFVDNILIEFNNLIIHDIKIKLLDLKGNVVINIKNPSGKKNINLSELSQGTYILVIETDRGNFTKKILKG